MIKNKLFILHVLDHQLVDTHHQLIPHIQLLVNLYQTLFAMLPLTKGATLQY